jgi:hypothetical protein
VDQAWHGLLLFTELYQRFCEGFLGQGLIFHHSPLTARSPGRAKRYADTLAKYAEAFGGQPPLAFWGPEQATAAAAAPSSSRKRGRASDGAAAAPAACAVAAPIIKLEPKSGATAMKKQKQESSFKIFVKTTCGKTITLDVEPHLRRHAAPCWPHAVRLQHPEGEQAALSAEIGRMLRVLCLCRAPSAKFVSGEPRCLTSLDVGQQT